MPAAEIIRPVHPVQMLVKLHPLNRAQFSLFYPAFYLCRDRAIARIMPKYLPKQVYVIIKNVPGAGGTRGATILYRSKPDGYTVGILNFPGVLALALVKEVLFDLDKYSYMGRVAVSPYCLSLPKGSPFKTLQDLQQSKKPILFSDTGRGSTSHLVGLVGTAKLKIPAEWVLGYPSAPAAMVGAIKGDAEAVIAGGIESQLQYIKSGDLRALFTFTAERNEYLPDIPTVKELGHNGELVQLAIHRLVAAPPGVPKDVIEILREALKRSLEDPELKKWSVEGKRPLDWASAEESRELVARFTKLFSQYKDVLAQ